MRYMVASYLLSCVCAGTAAGQGMPMNGMYGPYAMTREGSGTSWQPEAEPMDGVHAMKDDWMLMSHGYANGIYDNQGGERGSDKLLSTSMFMFMGQHPLGEGTFGLRSMISLDPAMGSNGYPLLLQTGETGDGSNGLIDRQHPHNLLMELAGTYSYPLSDEASIFGYAGLPGEPALGPPVFMHRFSGEDIPEAPITHHWLDSTHVSFGVTTLGGIWRDWKIEGSAFNGLEPNEYRWGFEQPRLDSWSTRLSYNPAPRWALQVSFGHLKSPEDLDSQVNQDRTTASAMYSGRWGENPWQATFAWGRDRDTPGLSLDGFLLEATLRLRQKFTLFGRAERVTKDDLFPVGAAQYRQDFTVNKFSMGGIYDFAHWKHSQWGIGGLGSAYALPASLNTVYGKSPLSYMLFARVKLI
jgi:hypothetical protein